MRLCKVVPAQYPQETHILLLNSFPLPRLGVLILRNPIEKRVHLGCTNIRIQPAYSLIEHLVKYLLCNSIFSIPQNLIQKLFKDTFAFDSFQHLMKDIRGNISSIFLPILEIWRFLRILIRTLTRSRRLPASFFFSPFGLFLSLSLLLSFFNLLLLNNSYLRSWQVLFIIVYCVPFSLIPREIINRLVIRR